CGYNFRTSANRARASPVGCGMIAWTPKNSARVNRADSIRSARSSAAVFAVTVSVPRCGLRTAKDKHEALIAKTIAFPVFNPPLLILVRSPNQFARKHFMLCVVPDLTFIAEAAPASVVYVVFPVTRRYWLLTE